MFIVGLLDKRTLSFNPNIEVEMKEIVQATIRLRLEVFQHGRQWGRTWAARFAGPEDHDAYLKAHPDLSLLASSPKGRTDEDS